RSAARWISSLPARERGLKLVDQIVAAVRAQSLPARERGLKLTAALRIQRDDVAPRAGAWVETSSATVTGPSTRVAPRAGAWVETMCPPERRLRPGRSPRGSVG